MRTNRILLFLAVWISAAALAVAQTNSPAGKWQVTMVPNAPWVFEFTAQSNELSGTIRQSGAQNTPISITDGKISGTTFRFTVKSPDGQRTITFIGRVNGNEISFVRQITILAGGSGGGNDLFGTGAALQFVARRAR
ncbi:MAG TPA: hypothetical protein VK210_06970 [Terriglobia bacterium]|nr:hypothetical protein [Terriglobia bacterium]